MTDGNEPSGTALSEHARMLDRVIIAMVAIALAGTCLLISAQRGTEAGQQAWKPNSVLRVIAELMALDYQYPTQRGVEIKWLTQGLGAAAVVLAAGVMWFVRTRREEAGFEGSVCAPPSSDAETPKGGGFLSRMAPTTGAQVALLMLAGWALLSAWWAPWPAGAAGEGLRQLAVGLWAVGLGRCLSRRGARAAAVTMVIVLAVTAGLGVWYYLERNPEQRLKFPIGNPIFLAACLIPGVTLAMAGLIGGMSAAVGRFLRGLSESQTVAGAAAHVGSAWWLPVGAGLALALMAWAFVLADSRGPLVGLVAGGLLVACAMAVLFGRRWARRVVVVLAVVAVLGGGLWCYRQLGVEAGGRGDTVRLRLYAWKHAFAFFQVRPLSGAGQGAYALLATQASLTDAEQDPAAFVAYHLEHAHSEWLEILADLGAVGLALLVTCLGLTCWAAVLALREKGMGVNHWFLLGLVAGLTGIMVQEAFSVGLRKPGLPVVLYTTMGLVWAMCRTDAERGEGWARRYGRVTRMLGLGGAVAASMGITWLSVRDWQGALAVRRSVVLAEKNQWEEALAQADLAERQQLSVEDRVFGLYQQVWVGHQAAEYQVRQAQYTLARLQDAEAGQGGDARPGRLREGGPTRENVVPLVQEDVARFAGYASICAGAGQQLLARMPAHHSVAGFIGDLWLMRGQMEAVAQRLGLMEGGGSYVDAARHWMQLEYARNRLDAENGLRLLALLPQDYPLARRVDLIRLPLRRVGRQMEVFEQMAAALMALSQVPGFDGVMRELLVPARAAAEKPEAEPWPEAYAPETLRLAALVHQGGREFAEAAGLADAAAGLYQRIRTRFPEAVSCARLDEAHYLLLGYPDEAARAVEACREAIAAWPKVRQRDEQLAPLRRFLAYYLLAAGQEQEARQTIKLIDPGVPEDELGAEVGQLLADLCRLFLPFERDRRPARLDDWLRRALELAPNSALARQVAIHVAFERGEDTTAIAQLEALETILTDTRQMVAYVRGLVGQFPDNAALKAFIASRTGGQVPATQPTGTAPSSQTIPADDMHG